jgi:hypothetical protein
LAVEPESARFWLEATLVIVYNLGLSGNGVTPEQLVLCGRCRDGEKKCRVVGTYLAENLETGSVF